VLQYRQTYGAVYVDSKDVAKALRVAGKIKAGVITINKAFGFDTNSAFGGWKGKKVAITD
jgi:acyl-CoA reductase-like NAD-dependent aldehyde dehydrogenase